MIRDYQDLSVAFNAENEDDVPKRKAPPKLPRSRTWGRRVCPSRHLVLILLGLSIVLTVTVIVFGAKGHLYNSQLQKVQESLESLNQTAGKEITDLQKQETGAEGRLTDVEGRVKQLTEEANGAREHLLNQMKELQKSHIRLNCDFEDFKHNRTDRVEACCPKGWDAFRKSCYWESRVGKPWQEAKAECESRDAHLVIINSYEEQQFVAVRVRPQYMWIGLTDSSGSWKWVDGSPYAIQQQYWCADQPDDWYGHGLGGGEDCAHLHRDGCWNDDHCTRDYGWICEMEMNT
ncbi:asialoglycoprotein receptor 1-like [Python bivittatus]|uniref:Asialoglycoprotein receptor 1-like n=1 Tax=Python bivittatus TaxID=176946 RepID=A0A9F5MYJ6_PYTBI|nr:asialoglycoprotein receptor 1-like [Python bivittatus]XP_025031067.1 asialoglycoprotein receptor 1-like [Python bivittatus]XP_025031068.1 asialoglycoprotein receptor 1-like [Python bivittatus]XP_025031069.1 asialoglycoprotein receptor 1-like [Python bivittatus]